MAEVAVRLGVTARSPYGWITRYSVPAQVSAQQDSQGDEIRRLKVELRRVTEERNILKQGCRVLRQALRVKYAFIDEQVEQHPVRRLCAVMQVNPSRYYG